MTNEEKQRKIAEENRKLTDIQEQANLYAGECPEFAKEWMKKRLESYAKKHDYNLPPADEIGNTMDWLHDLQNSDPKLANKIDRISWEAGQGHQQKWHDGLVKKAEKLSKFEGNPDDITTMIKYEDGFQWVKLNSAEAKDFEGDAMGNCVGRGGYDNKTIFSLRDKDNFPHITVDYDEKTKTIQQMKCKGNSKVTDDYMPVVENLISELKPTKINDIDDYAISNDGIYYLGIESINQATKNGSKFDKDNINITESSYALSKDGCLYVGETSINQAIENGISFDNDNINIRGSYALSKDGRLYLGDTAINQAIENGINFDNDNINIRGNHALSKDGRLYLGDDAINKASDKGVKFDKVNIDGNYALTEDGRYYLGEDAIKNIPEGVVLKDVNIEKCENITEWNHKVTGNFNASGSGLKTIGEDAQFGGDVIISSCKDLTEWNHNIGGNFHARGSGLTTVGLYADYGLDFGGNVDVRFCEDLTDWNGNVEGNFDAQNSNLERIGPDVTFEKDVNIYKTEVTEWNNRVDGNLSIPVCIETIGPDTYVGGLFDASQSGLKEVSPDAYFDGDVDINYCESLSNFHSVVKGNINTLNSGLDYLDVDNIEGKIELTGTPLSEEYEMDEVNTSEEKQQLINKINGMEDEQEEEQKQEQTPEPEEEEHSMSM